MISTRSLYTSWTTALTILKLMVHILKYGRDYIFPTPNQEFRDTLALSVGGAKDQNAYRRRSSRLCYSIRVDRSEEPVQCCHCLHLALMVVLAKYGTQMSDISEIAFDKVDSYTK